MTTEGASRNPLKHTADASGALSLMLSPGAPGQLPADQALAFAFRELQAHQVALLGATRAALRGALQHFSPQQLTLCFEREGISYRLRLRSVAGKLLSVTTMRCVEMTSGVNACWRETSPVPTKSRPA